MFENKSFLINKYIKISKVVLCAAKKLKKFFWLYKVLILESLMVVLILLQVDLV